MLARQVWYSMSAILAIWEAWSIMVQDQLRQKAQLAGGVDKEVKHLPIKWEAPSSNLSTAK
jgi:hypothetical protein